MIPYIKAVGCALLYAFQQWIISKDNKSVECVVDTDGRTLDHERVPHEPISASLSRITRRGPLIRERTRHIPRSAGLPWPELMWIANYRPIAILLTFRKKKNQLSSRKNSRALETCLSWLMPDYTDYSVSSWISIQQ